MPREIVQRFLQHPINVDWHILSQLLADAGLFQSYMNSGLPFENRNLLDIPAVFAGLLTVIIIGLIVENLIFRTIERNTVQKWGTQS